MNHKTGQVRLLEFPEAGEVVTMKDMLVLWTDYATRFGMDAKFVIQIHSGMELKLRPAAIIPTLLSKNRKSFPSRLPPVVL